MEAGDAGGLAGIPNAAPRGFPMMMSPVPPIIVRNDARRARSVANTRWRSFLN